MRRRLRLAAVAGLASALLASSHAMAQDKDPFDQLNDEFQAFVSQMNLEWRAYLDETDQEYRQFVAEVEREWGAFVPSTRPVWSSYATDLKAHGEADFENGTVVVEVLESAAAPLDTDRLAKQLAGQLGAMVSDRNPAAKNVLQDQVDRGDGKPLESPRVLETVKAKVEAGEVERRRTRGGDGQARTVVTLRLGMVPDHLTRRAQPFIGLVREEAKRFDVEPDLVLAVIHTESWFNPLARSSIPAFGLMQVVPKFAGADAHEFIYSEKRVLQPKDLYQPDRNVELGSAYLHLLLSRYFGSLRDPGSRTLAAIAGYNCGPGNVRAVLRKLDSKGEVRDDLAEDQVRSALLERAPAETRDYVRRVTDRRRRWRGEKTP